MTNKEKVAAIKAILGDGKLVGSGSTYYLQTLYLLDKLNAIREVVDK